MRGNRRIANQGRITRQQDPRRWTCTHPISLVIDQDPGETKVISQRPHDGDQVQVAVRDVHRQDSFGRELLHIVLECLGVKQVHRDSIA